MVQKLQSSHQRFAQMAGTTADHSSHVAPTPSELLSSPMRSPPLPNHTFRPSPKEAPMRISINLLDQHGELPIRCQRLIRLPSERRPLPKQPPLSRLAIELEFRDPVIHPSRRIVPYHPHFDNQHILALDTIFRAHLMASVGRRAPTAQRPDDGFDALQFNFGERQRLPPSSSVPVRIPLLVSPQPPSESRQTRPHCAAWHAARPCP